MIKGSRKAKTGVTHPLAEGTASKEAWVVWTMGRASQGMRKEQMDKHGGSGPGRASEPELVHLELPEGCRYQSHHQIHVCKRSTWLLIFSGRLAFFIFISSICCRFYLCSMAFGESRIPSEPQLPDLDNGALAASHHLHRGLQSGTDYMPTLLSQESGIISFSYIN